MSYFLPTAFGKGRGWSTSWFSLLTVLEELGTTLLLFYEFGEWEMEEDDEPDTFLVSTITWLLLFPPNFGDSEISEESGSGASPAIIKSLKLGCSTLNSLSFDGWSWCLDAKVSFYLFCTIFYGNLVKLYLLIYLGDPWTNRPLLGDTFLLISFPSQLNLILS